MINEIKRMQQLAGIQLNELEINNSSNTKFFVSFNSQGSSFNTPLEQVLRVVVDEINSWDEEEGSVEGAYDNIVDADPNNDNSDFYGSLETNLQAFRKLPNKITLTTDLNGEEETYVLKINKNDCSWIVLSGLYND